jgi:hypothetical protein
VKLVIYRFTLSLIPILVFLLKLINDEEDMGKYTNRPMLRIVAGTTIGSLIVPSALLLVTTFCPDTVLIVPTITTEIYGMNFDFLSPQLVTEATLAP